MNRRTGVMVVCGAGMLMVVMGIRQTFGLFLPAITGQLGVGREPFSLAIALMNLLFGAASPVAGAVADRFGAGRVAVAGGVFYALGLWLMASAGDTATLIGAGLLVGLGLSGAGFSVVLGAVGRAVPSERRAQAFALVTMGGSLGQFLAVPYTQALLGHFSWVVSVLVLMGTSLLLVPLAAGVHEKKAITAGGPPKQTLRQAFDEAKGHRGFWLLTAGFFVCGFHLAFIGLHLPAYLTDLGFRPWLAASGLMLIGGFNIVGTYIFGTLGGRFSKKKVLATLYLARSAVFLLFVLTPISQGSVLLFSAAMGLLWLGTVPLTSGLVAQIFGPANMSMLYGIVFFSHQVGSFSGAWLSGYLYDTFGSYELMWWLNVGLGVAAAALHWPIVERPVTRLAPVVGSD